MPVGTLSLEGHAADEVELVAEVLCPLFVESPLTEACQLHVGNEGQIALDVSRVRLLCKARWGVEDGTPPQPAPVHLQP